MIRLAVFDLDGTLVDSRRDLANAANALVAARGANPLPEDAIAGMVGEGAAVLVRRVLAASGLDAESPGALSDFLDLYDQRLLEHTVPYDGIVEMLEALSAGLRLAVLTNKPQAHTDRLLDGLGLTRYFRDVIGGDTPFGRKPGPSGLEELARRADVPVTATALIGDSPIDLQTARAAGCACVLVSYGFGYRLEPLHGSERAVTAAALIPGALDDLASA
jgi:phosphoglycolate phosphatase